MSDTSMSALKTFLNCQKRYEYQYVRGLRPLRESTDVMDLGTLFHAGCQAGYKLGKDAAPITMQGYWLKYAHTRVDETIANGYDYHGERREIKVDEEQVQLVHDMLDYYWENVGQHDQFDEVVAVEEPFVLEVGGYSIRNTFDLVVREAGRIVVYDHKTVGNVKESAEFLPLDFQVGAYMVAAASHFGEPVEFVYNMVRRAVPKELTKSGRKSTSSKDPMDYLRRERLWKNETELGEWRNTLESLVDEMDRKTTANVPAPSFLRNPVKGYMGCLGCAYKSLCSAELIGQKIDGSMLEYSFTTVAA